VDIIGMENGGAFVIALTCLIHRLEGWATLHRSVFDIDGRLILFPFGWDHHGKRCTHDHQEHKKKRFEGVWSSVDFVSIF
jgi:hypothetical protein